jgi:hypothetical protein
MTEERENEDGNSNSGGAIALVLILIIVSIGFAIKYHLDSKEQGYADQKWKEIKRHESYGILTIKDIEQFIDWYPDSDQIAEANELREKLHEQNQLNWAKIEKQMERGFIKCKSKIENAAPIRLRYEEVPVYYGPGKKYGKVVNKKVLESMNTLLYIILDPSIDIIVKVCEEGDWSRVVVYKPAYLADSHSGWVENDGIEEL